MYIYIYVTRKGNSRDSSVDTVTRLRAELPKKNVVRLSAEARDLPFLQSGRTNSGVHPTVYSVGNRGYFPEGVTAEA